MKFKLIKKYLEEPQTKSFFWKPEKSFNFEPGQYLYYTLPKLKYPDPRGPILDFTIASSPTEKLIQLTSRISNSGFKRTLDELPIESIIEGEGPNGSFYLDDKTSGNQVFIAGGIGVTPFRSMIKYNIDKNLKHPMYLIYSNSDDKFVYKKEFDTWQKDNNFIKVSYFDSSELGHLNKSMIEKLFDTWHLKFDIPTYWLAGPPQFVDSMELILGKFKIPDDKIKSDKFTGY